MKDEDINEIVDRQRDTTIHYTSKPYEQFCKENLIWISRYLDSMKLGTGLSLQMKDWFGKHKLEEQISDSIYKAIRMSATKDRLRVRVSYTIMSNNYAQDMATLLKQPAVHAKTI